MQSKAVLSSLALLASSSLAFAQSPGGMQQTPGGASPPSARELAPGQKRDPGTPAREFAPGQNRGEGSARDEAPGRMLQESQQGRSGGEGRRSEGRAEEQESERRAGGSDRERTDERAGREREAEGRGQQSATERGEGSAATGRGEGREGSGAGGAADVQLSSEQRTKVKEAFSGQRRASVNVDVDVSTGVSVPRTIELYPVPQTVVEIVPAFRGYRYFVVDDRICIVDPETYVIVEVIVLA